MTIYEQVQALAPDMVALRRDLHAHPEIAWQETRTQQVICARLDALGIPYETPHRTAVIATITGKSAHPCVGLRADMDALSVHEQNDVDYRSQTDGCMHACGHDGHVAMLLTAAQVLQSRRDQLNGTVVLIFQPAEEIAGGGKILAPMLTQVDQFMTIHLWNDFPVGKISVEAGPRMAATDHLTWKIHGTGAHGAQPQQGVDAIVIAGQMICALQTVSSRFVSPLEPMVLTLGKISGGRGYNVIADEVEIVGTLRTFDPALRERILAQIERISTQTAQMYGGSCEVICRAGHPPVVNHPDCSALAAQAVQDSLGADFLAPLQQRMAGEDFAWYLEQAKGCLCFVGSRNEDTGKCFAHHHPQFDIDEDALTYGATLYASYAMTALTEI